MYIFKLPIEYLGTISAHNWPQDYAGSIRHSFLLPVAITSAITAFGATNTFLLLLFLLTVVFSTVAIAVHALQLRLVCLTGTSDLVCLVSLGRPKPINYAFAQNVTDQKRNYLD